MSRALVRQAVAGYLGGQADPNQPSRYRGSPVTYLGTLYSSWARADRITGDDYWPGVGAMSGAIVVVHIPDSHEQREALGGQHSGKKTIDYTITLETFFRSQQPQLAAGMDDYDTFLDSLVTVIRADRTFGTGGLTEETVWQAGEGAGIDIAHDDPTMPEQGILHIHGICRFTATAWVTS